MDSDSEARTVAHLPPAWSAGISPFGFVVQTLRFNSLYCSDGHGAFGIRPRYTEDLCRQLCLSAKARTSIAARIPAASILAPLWQPTAWQAFGGSATHWRPYLSGCTECMKTGYHSMLFQMPWVNRCPWHSQPLSSQCDHCSRPLWHGFRSDAPPLLCPCGHDPVSSRNTLDEEGRIEDLRGSWIKRYLRWAGASRGRRTLIGVGDDLTSAEEAAVLFRGRAYPWYRPKYASSDVLIRASTVRHGQSVEARSQKAAFSRLAPSMGPGRDFFLELPQALERPMARITASVAAKFRESTFSARERACLGLPEASEGGGQPSSRASVVLLPAYRVREHLFLDGRVLGRPTQAVLREIAQAMSLLPSDNPAIEALARAYERVLGRGFASSALHLLGRLDGSATDDEAALIRPVVLIRHRRSSCLLTLAWLGCARKERSRAGGQV